MVGETLEIRDEFRLLLLCARTRVEPQQRELIRALALKQLDWEFILDKAQSHALIPLLYRNLSEFCADRVPSAVLQQLESVYIANAKRNQVLTAELIKILRILESADISAVPYKGPALAALGRDHLHELGRRDRRRGDGTARRHDGWGGRSLTSWPASTRRPVGCRGCR